MEKIKWIDEYIDEGMRLAVDEGHEPALNLLEKLLFDEPGYGRLHHAIAKIYLFFAEENKKAEKHFRMAILFDPEFAEPYHQLGQLLYQDERLDQAIRIFRRGLKAKQANKSGLLKNVGQVYELKMRYRKAIRHYKEALSHSAELWDCLVIEESIRRCKRKRQ